MLAFVTNDEFENIVALFDNAIDYARHEGCNPTCACGSVEKYLDGRITTMRFNGTINKYRLRVIDVFEEDRHTKTLREFREEWLYAMGDIPLVVYTDNGKKKHGLSKAKDGNCKTMNDSFFDKFDDYIVEDVIWKKRVTVWLGNP